MRVGGFRIGDELEPVLRTGSERRVGRGSPDRQLDAGRRLEEVTSEGRVVVERPHFLDAAPMNTHRSQEAGHQPQRVKRIQAVRHRERIEDVAAIFDMKSRLASIEVDVNVSLGDFNRPQEERGSSSRIVRMRAQRARCDAVNSKKGERALVPLLVGGDEFADHESRIRVERVGGFSARLRISSPPAEIQIDLPHEPLEIRDGRGIAAFRVRARTVCRGCRAIYWPRKIEMQGSEWPRRSVGYRKGNSTPLVVIVVGNGKGRRPQGGTEDGACTHTSVQ